jgi:hypothetical protein
MWSVIAKETARPRCVFDCYRPSILQYCKSRINHEIDKSEKREKEGIGATGASCRVQTHVQAKGTFQKYPCRQLNLWEVVRFFPGSFCALIVVLTSTIDKMSHVFRGNEQYHLHSCGICRLLGGTLRALSGVPALEMGAVCLSFSSIRLDNASSRVFLGMKVTVLANADRTSSRAGRLEKKSCWILPATLSAGEVF